MFPCRGTNCAREAAPLRGASRGAGRTQRSASLHAGLDYGAPPALFSVAKPTSFQGQATRLPRSLRREANIFPGASLTPAAVLASRTNPCVAGSPYKNQTPGRGPEGPLYRTPRCFIIAASVSSALQRKRPLPHLKSPAASKPNPRARGRQTRPPAPATALPGRETFLLALLLVIATVALYYPVHTIPSPTSTTANTSTPTSM